MSTPPDATVADQGDDLAERIAAAIAAHRAIPPLDAALDLDTAYAVQRRVSHLVDPSGAGGIKVGVTAPAAQAHFGLDHALLGHLYAAHAQGPGAVLRAIPGRALECEVAILVDADGQPQALAPAIEVVRVEFSRPADMTAANLVAINLGADAHVLGAFQPWSAEPADIAIRLERDGVAVNETRAAEALGGPARAIAWVQEEAPRRGLRLADGMVVMTGACGAVVPAVPGAYRADFGTLGELAFSVG